jgi:N-acyl-phosphatidylethanolamine-hydrolysing phospholipase D
MRYQHMNPAEAVRAASDLAARFAVAIHWGTFDLTDEPVDLAPRALGEALDAAGPGAAERFRALAIGETWHAPDS